MTTIASIVSNCYLGAMVAAQANPYNRQTLCYTAANNTATTITNIIGATNPAVALNLVQKFTI